MTSPRSAHSWRVRWGTPARSAASPKDHHSSGSQDEESGAAASGGVRNALRGAPPAAPVSSWVMAEVYTLDARAASPGPARQPLKSRGPLTWRDGRDPGRI